MKAHWRQEKLSPDVPGTNFPSSKMNYFYFFLISPSICFHHTLDTHIDSRVGESPIEFLQQDL